MYEYVKFIPIWLYLRHPTSLCSEPLWKLQCPNDLVHILICLCEGFKHGGTMHDVPRNQWVPLVPQCMAPSSLNLIIT